MAGTAGAGRAGGIGLALGFGFYLLGLVAFLAVAAILVLGGLFVGKDDRNA